jgi:tetratricopeptide (TPR) repeat protein
MKGRKNRTTRKKIKIFRDAHLLWGLFLLTLLSAYYRGLYFDFERFRFYIFFWLIAGIFFFIRFFGFQEKMTLKTGVEWSFFFLTLLYLVNIPWAADKGLALREFLTYFTFFLLFFIVEYTSSSRGIEKRWFLFLFGVSAGVLIFLSLFYHFGLVPPIILPTYMSLRELFVGGRIYSNFQYPNTAAAYFSMAYFGILIFALLEKRRFWRWLSLFLSFLILGGVVFTYSRGNFLVFPLVFLFLLVILPRAAKIRLFLIEVISGLSLVVFFPLLERYLFDGRGGQFLGLFLGGAFLVAGATEFLLEHDERWLQLSNRVYALLGVVLGVGGIVAFLLGKYSQLLPPHFAQRIRSITLSDPNVVGRFTFYRDALKIGLERPLNGWGGGAWKVLYFGYQSAPYFTESTHNFYAQLFVEGGFLGILLMLGLLFFLFWETWKAREYLSSQETILALGILGVLFMGFAHGLLDINFSLGAYHFAVWFFAGILGGMVRDKVQVVAKKFIFSSGWGFLVSVAFLVLVSLMAFGIEQGMVGEYLLKQGDVGNAIAFYRDAARFDPLNSEVHLALSQSFRALFLSDGNAIWRTESEKEAWKAYRLSPFKYTHLEHLGLLYVEKGEFEKGLSFFREAVSRAPFIPAMYEHLALAYRSVGDFYVAQGQKEKALEFYRAGVVVWDLLLENTRRSEKPLEGLEGVRAIVDELANLLKKE